MTGPKPGSKKERPPRVYAPGGRPVSIPDLNVSGHAQNAIELAFRQMGMHPEQLAQSQADFRARQAAFAHDFPRALPSGIPAFVGGAATDVASLDLPFLPPALPAVRAKGDELTTRLTQYLHRLFGAPEGSEGTQAGTEIGGIAASVLAPELLGALGRGEAAGYALPKIGHQAGESSRLLPPKVLYGPPRPPIREAPIGRGPRVDVPARSVSEVPAYLRPLLAEQQRLFAEDPNYLLPDLSRSTHPLTPTARVQPWRIRYIDRDAVPFTWPDVRSTP